MRATSPSRWHWPRRNGCLHAGGHALTGLGELRRWSRGRQHAEGADELGEQGGHQADTAAEVGDAQSPAETRLEEHAATAWSVEPVQVRRRCAAASPVASAYGSGAMGSAT